MFPAPDRSFESWTVEEIVERAAAEPLNVMPGSGRAVPGPWRKLADSMVEANVSTAGELPRQVMLDHKFVLVTWPAPQVRRS